MTPETTLLGLLKTLAEQDEEIKTLRAQVAQYKEDAERYAFAKTLEGQVVTMEAFKNLGASALDDALNNAMAEDAAIDKARSK